MDLLSELEPRIRSGEVVPYLGPGALAGAASCAGGEPIPADGESLILAMNGGRPMAPTLMYEFPRAAMNVELKRGRSAVTRFLDRTYGTTRWTRARLHDWLGALAPPYVVDVNRDTQLQDSYSSAPHTLVRGIARLGGGDHRFRIHQYDGAAYREIDPEGVNESLPVLFKPMGSPVPDPTYVASDADYVDYITELMGGFAIPAFLKRYRRGRRYLLLGLRLTRDTERMVLAEIIHGAADPAGWALIPDPTAKERRSCARLGLELVEADAAALLSRAA